ncbi:DUF58 domain-containing protein [Halobacteriales archaeon QS_1_68_17]|nr:MAG: DUF58 domain-containing protein [Halobacteriales archaeon QS_1_68_17]
MRPTRRTGALVAFLAVLVWLSATHGPRALNAIAAPVVVALAAGLVHAAWLDPPAITRSDPVPCFPGETRTVELDVDGGGLARVDERVGDLPAAGTTAETTLPGTVTYELEPERRGVYPLGPATVTVTDAFGLFERTFETGSSGELVVYPTVYDVADRSVLSALLGDALADERSEFDRIREYDPGDSLRDINWKSSAKREELVVTEFATGREGETVTVAGHAAEGERAADRMASAVATVAVSLLDAGMAVGVAVPGGELPPGGGDHHRRRLLDLLARTPGGSVDAPDAEVVVRARDDDLAVSVAGREQPVEAVTGRRRNPLSARGGDRA